MEHGGKFTDQQIQQIIEAVQARPMVVPPIVPPHSCRFDDVEAKAMHGLTDALDNGGLDNFRMVLEFGATLRQIRKWGTAAIVTTVIGGLLLALWAGFKASVTSGRTYP